MQSSTKQPLIVLFCVLPLVLTGAAGCADDGGGTANPDELAKDRAQGESNTVVEVFLTAQHDLLQDLFGNAVPDDVWPLLDVDAPLAEGVTENGSYIGYTFTITPTRVSDIAAPGDFGLTPAEVAAALSSQSGHASFEATVVSTEAPNGVQVWGMMADVADTASPSGTRTVIRLIDRLPELLDIQESTGVVFELADEFDIESE